MSGAQRIYEVGCTCPDEKCPYHEQAEWTVEKDAQLQKLDLIRELAKKILFHNTPLQNPCNAESRAHRAKECSLCQLRAFLSREAESLKKP